MLSNLSAVELDHLVVAAKTVAEGVDWIADLTGVAPVAGGRHLAMGTHNALLKLGPRSYLEVIAIDPAGTKPPRPRWFGLDGVALQAELAERPRLIHWVARTGYIANTAARCPMALGAVQSMIRGDYRWQITIPDDGALPGRGLVPTLIQWDVPAHPASTLPASGIALRGLAGSHPEPAPIRAALIALGAAEAISVTYDREVRLVAMLSTPRGTVTLSS